MLIFDNYVQLANSRIPRQYRHRDKSKKTVHQARLQAIYKVLRDIEIFIEIVQEALTLDEGFGFILDNFGKQNWISRPQGADDDTYRAIIKAKIVTLIANGTPEYQERIVKFIHPEASEFKVNRLPGRRFSLQYKSDSMPGFQDILVKYLNDSTRAGEKMLGLDIYNDNTFMLGIGPDDGNWGSEYVKTIGGTIDYQFYLEDIQEFVSPADSLMEITVDASNSTLGFRNINFKNGSGEETFQGFVKKRVRKGDRFELSIIEKIDGWYSVKVEYKELENAS